MLLLIIKNKTTQTDKQTKFWTNILAFPITVVDIHITYTADQYYFSQEMDKSTKIYEWKYKFTIDWWCNFIDRRYKTHMVGHKIYEWNPHVTVRSDVTDIQIDRHCDD